MTRPKIRRNAVNGAKIVNGSVTGADVSEGPPAFLETPNPQTIPLYERHGFEVVATAQAGGCPPLTSMLRVAP